MLLVREDDVLAGQPRMLQAAINIQSLAPDVGQLYVVREPAY